MTSNSLSDHIRNALSVAITTSPARRQLLFSLLPPETFKGPAIYYKLARFFATDTVTESFADIAKATGLDPVALVALTGEDESFRPLSEHLVRLLSARQTAALAEGLDVTQWAAAITIISEAAASPQEGDESHIQLIQACNIQPESIVWLWNGWLPCGKLVIIAGQPGTGKTTITLAVAAVITTGGRLPDGTLVEAGIVVIWSGEDGVEDTLVPRLIAMGADMSKVYFVTGKGKAQFNPSQDMPQLAEQVKALANVKLIIIDPVVSAINGDSHKNAEVRRGLQPLVDLGRDTGACIVGISHFNKSGGNTSNPLDLISGSIAFAAVARVVLGAAKLNSPDPEHGHSRIFCRIKSNIGPDEDGIGYDLRMESLAGYEMEASTVLWGQCVEGHSRDLLSQAQPETDNPKANTRAAEAEDFLSDLLSVGAVAQKTIEEEAGKAGIAEKTLRRAKKSLSVISKKNFSGWTWELPVEDGQDQDGQTSIKNNHGRLGHLGHLEDAILVNMAKMPNMASENLDDNLATLNSATLPNFDF